MDLPPTGHESVLLHEVLHYLAPRPGHTIIDCTIGRAGHAAALSDCIGPTGLLIGLDVDPNNLLFAKSVLQYHPAPFRLFHANFAEINNVIRQANASPNAILADLGLSTNQLADPHYGLSFAQDMPLDVRIDPRLTRTAADLVNFLPEKDLANVLYNLAQERYSRSIARKIAETRRISPMTTTGRLAELVRSAIGKRAPVPQKIDPATRTFLALRMCVNQEIENLQAFLKTAPKLLSPGSAFAVISFQSSEDRLVKQAFRSEQEAGDFRVLTKKPISPSEDEIARNPRSRSAKMRVIARN